jgi:hypothetical protein
VSNLNKQISRLKQVCWVVEHVFFFYVKNVPICFLWNKSTIVIIWCNIKKSFFYFYVEVLIPIALLFSFYPRKHSYSLYWVGSGWWCRGHVTQCTSFSFKYSGDLYLMKIRKINIENKYVPCTSDAFGAPVYIFRWCTRTNDSAAPSWGEVNRA